jgi:hypothetical protein
MIWIILGLLLLLAAVFAHKIEPLFAPGQQRIAHASGLDLPLGAGAIRLLAGLLAALCFLPTSFVSIGEDETGHLVKIYGFRSLPPGRIIATEAGMSGPQAEVIPPGVHLSLFINVLNKIEKLPVLEVPDGQYAALTARDGEPLRDGQAFADPVPMNEFKKMVTDANYALSHGLQMGPQATILPPGKYRINHYLFDTKLGNALDVDKGYVAVVKSNVQGAVNFGNLSVPTPKQCDPVLRETTSGVGALSVPVVPVGCLGIWETALQPNRYYINQAAYNVRLVETRIQQWEYKGGYKKRDVDLKVAENGRLEQEEHTEDIPVPQGSVDSAVYAKVEGWSVPIELRVLVQVAPEDAPFTVAAVGGIQEVEDRIITPAIRAVTRDVLGGMIRIEQPVLDKDGNIVMENGAPKTAVVVRATRVLDLINNRPAIEETIAQRIRPEGMKARVDIKEIRLGESAIPPEVLMPQQRQQLGEQLGKAYIQEKLAQEQRIATEQARATADQQEKLVEAQIEQERSLQLANARKNEGEGEKARLTAIAEGQRIQANALGEERVMKLRQFEILTDKVFNFLNAHPEVIATGIANAQKFVPERVFTIGATEGSGTIGAFGILGEMLNPSNAGSLAADKGAGKK